MASAVGDYACNGLNRRITRQADTDLDNDRDQRRIMYYSAAPGIWQLLAEDVWDHWRAQTPDDIDRHVQYASRTECVEKAADCPGYLR